MGQQQLILVILGIIIIGIAIAVGIALFGASDVQSNKDAIISDLNALSSTAYQYRVRLRTMGGGNSYTDFNIPLKLQSTDDGTFSIVTVAANSVQFLATSRSGYGSITVNVDSTGTMSILTYTGDFQ